MSLFKESWALTAEAEQAIQCLNDEYGIDTDLGLAIIVRVWPEAMVFSLEEEAS